MASSRRLHGPSLQERVTALDGELSPAQRQVARFLAQHPDLAATASSIELGERTGTSNATVIRTVKALGFSGLQQLRHQLVEVITARLNPSEVLAHQVQRLTKEAPVPDQVLASTTLSLQQARQILDHQEWSRAVSILGEATEIFCYGVEQAGCIAEIMSIELSRYGKPSRCATTTGLGLAQDLLTIRRSQAVVLVAPLRHFRELDVIIEHAQSLRCPVVLITEALGLALEDSVDAVIAAPQSTDSLTSEVAVPLVLAKALTLEVARSNQHRSITTHNLLNKLRTEVVGHSLDVEPPFGANPEFAT